MTRFFGTAAASFPGKALSQTAPATQTAFVSSLDLSSSTTESGSVGVNADGPTATAGGSATQGQSINTTVPATMVINNAAPPLTAWEFLRQDTSGTEFNPQISWLWTLDWDDYGDGGEGTTGRILFNSNQTLGDETNLATNPCAVAYPFGGLTTVAEPTITDLSVSSVPQGGMFTITGDGLYPDAVTAVLLQGIDVGATNITANGETATGSGLYTLTITVPGTQETGTNTVVVQQEFNDMARFTNEATIDITAAQ